MDAIQEAMRLLVNAALLMERSRHLGADRCERTGSRQGHANGFKDKTFATRMGKITFSAPQVRGYGFYPSALEKRVLSNGL